MLAVTPQFVTGNPRACAENTFKSTIRWTRLEALVKPHYPKAGDGRRHLDRFVAADNFVRRLDTLKDLTPYEFICKL